MSVTDIEVRKARPKDKPYRITDGRGLYVEVMPTGGKYWRFKYSYGGKEKRLAIGVYPGVSVKEARAAADEARRHLVRGDDPGLLRRQTKLNARIAMATTFKTIAHEWWESRQDLWKPEHAQRIWGNLNKDIFPAIGNRAITDIEAPEILIALRKVEKRGALDVVGRELQHCKAIFRFAVQTGRAKYNPAVELTGALKTRKSRHFPSLKVADLPLFFARLRASPAEITTKIAVRLTMLTFVRPGELRHARWCDFDFQRREWRVPDFLMKMKEEHIVPLSSQAFALLQELKAITGQHALLFPGAKDRSIPISENTMNQCMNRMGYQGLATPHGFRAMACSTLNEQGFNPDAIERQLAHMERNSVRAAYIHHAQFLEDRRRMMQWWGDYLEQTEAMGSDAAALAGNIGTAVEFRISGSSMKGLTDAEAQSASG